MLLFIVMPSWKRKRKSWPVFFGKDAEKAQVNIENFQSRNSVTEPGNRIVRAAPLLLNHSMILIKNKVKRAQEEERYKGTDLYAASVV